MALKKIIQNAFEQVLETGKEMTKSSVKQVQETLSPLEMLQNSIGIKEIPVENGHTPSKEGQKKEAKHTPLEFNKLQTSYENQDKKRIEIMKQRLFQLVKKDEEKAIMKGKQEKAEKERTISQEEAEKRRREESQKRQLSVGNVPEGKSGRGTALLGNKKRRKPTEPQPAETKPGSGKQ